MPYKKMFASNHTESPLGRRGSILAIILAVAAVLHTAGCLPYVVGATPHTVPTGTHKFSASIFGAGPSRDVDSLSFFSPNEGGMGVVVEYRLGLSDKSDLGFRVDAPSSVGVNYKLRLLGSGAGDAAAFSVMVGTGVSLSSYAYAEATVLASTSQYGWVMPYGGLRLMKKFSFDSTSGTRAAGGLIGIRIGTAAMSILPEIGLYHHPRSGDYASFNVITPSITIRGFQVGR